MPKIAHLHLNALNASICIRMHQNVCIMNCAKVLCTKLSKNWFLLHLKGPKLTKYISHFMVVHPVVRIESFKKISLPYSKTRFRNTVCKDPFSRRSKSINSPQFMDAPLGKASLVTMIRIDRLKK